MKYAVFEFEDNTVEVGEVSNIIRDGEIADLADADLINRRVRVKWLTAGSSKIYTALVKAMSDDILKVRRKRNALCEGLSIETDIEMGRGKRRRKTRKLSESSTESEAEADDNEPEREVHHTKKTKKGQQRTISSCQDLASQLRSNLNQDARNVHVQDSDMEEERDGKMKETIQKLERRNNDLERRNNELKTQLDKERKEKDVLKNTLILLQDKIPKFVQTFEGFQAHLTAHSTSGSPKNKVMSTCMPRSVASTSAPPSPAPSLANSMDDSQGMSDFDEEDSDKLVALSSTVSISKKRFYACNQRDYGKYTNDLVVALFGREDLHKFSLTGAANSTGEKKPRLDKDKVDALISCVLKKFPMVSVEAVKTVITNKLSNEVKLRRRKAKVHDEA